MPWIDRRWPGQAAAEVWILEEPAVVAAVVAETGEDVMAEHPNGASVWRPEWFGVLWRVGQYQVEPPRHY